MQKKAALAAEREEEKVERRDWKVRRSSGRLPFLHLRSAALRLRLSVRTESDNQGADGVRRAGLEVRGQRWSREEDRVERRRSVAVSGDRREKDSGESRENRRGKISGGERAEIATRRNHVGGG